MTNVSGITEQSKGEQSVLPPPAELLICLLHRLGHTGGHHLLPKEQE